MTNSAAFWFVRFGYRLTCLVVNQPRRAKPCFGPPSPRCTPAQRSGHCAISCWPVKAQPVEICACVRVQPIGPSGARDFRFRARGRCDSRDTCDMQSRFLGFGGLRHLRHLRHGGRSRGLCRSCRSCRGSRRGVPRDFCQLRACIKPHRAPLSRLPKLRSAQHRAPRFRLPAAQATHAFRV